MYQVNTNFPMFNELQKIAFKHFGIDQIIEQVIEKLGDVEAVYLTGDLARGLDSKVVDVTLIGSHKDNSYLARLVEKAEALIGRKIRTLTYESDVNVELGFPRLLIYG
jgi:predicted nucleotidyltransferase